VLRFCITMTNPEHVRFAPGLVSVSVYSIIAVSNGNWPSEGREVIASPKDADNETCLLCIIMTSDQQYMYNRYSHREKIPSPHRNRSARSKGMPWYNAYRNHAPSVTGRTRLLMDVFILRCCDSVIRPFSKRVLL
jgi:hypothetical protein